MTPEAYWWGWTVRGVAFLGGLFVVLIAADVVSRWLGRHGW